MVKNIFFVGGCSDFRVFVKEMKEKKGRKNKKEWSKDKEKGKKDSFFNLRFRHLKKMKEKRKLETKKKSLSVTQTNIVNVDDKKRKEIINWKQI